VVAVLIEEMFRSDRNRPRDYETSRGRRCTGRRRTRKTTLRSGWTSTLKKDLTGPTLLEMSGNQEVKEVGDGRMRLLVAKLVQANALQQAILIAFIPRNRT
jgi:hypothetical protein